MQLPPLNRPTSSLLFPEIEKAHQNLTSSYMLYLYFWVLCVNFMFSFFKIHDVAWLWILKYKTIMLADSNFPEDKPFWCWVVTVDTSFDIHSYQLIIVVLFSLGEASTELTQTMSVVSLHTKILCLFFPDHHDLFSLFVLFLSARSLWASPYINSIIIIAHYEFQRSKFNYL